MERNKAFKYMIFLFTILSQQVYSSPCPSATFSISQTKFAVGPSNQNTSALWLVLENNNKQYILADNSASGLNLNPAGITLDTIKNALHSLSIQDWNNGIYIACIPWVQYYVGPNGGSQTVYTISVYKYDNTLIASENISDTAITPEIILSGSYMEQNIAAYAYENTAVFGLYINNNPKLQPTFTTTSAYTTASCPS